MIEAHLDAWAGNDTAFVHSLYRLLLRREPEPEALARALERLADGTLSRATLARELATSDELARVTQLDDAVARGLAARRRGEPLRWLSAPAGTDERVVEIPWVLSRLGAGTTLELGYANAEDAYLAALLACDLERLVGVDLAERSLDGLEGVTADARALPFADETFETILVVSTLEHIGADNSVYGLAAEDDPTARLEALRELRRVLRSDGRLLITVPLGEPGDHGWFRQDDVAGWTELFSRAGLFVEEQEAYELGEEGWVAAPAFSATGVRYGERGPAASAVLCTTLSRSRLKRLVSPSGLAATARRHARALRHRGS
ncbi:MAG: methyltransferase domain-containing protein [Gaiellales bacterium]